MNKVRLGVVSLASAVALVAGSAVATMDLQKQFGTTYPGAPKAKCSTCHVKAMPKKGEADLNAYGKDLLATKKDGKYDFAKIEKLDRKSTRLNSSHLVISYAVFCLKKK